MKNTEVTEPQQLPLIVFCACGGMAPIGFELCTDCYEDDDEQLEFYTDFETDED